MLKVWSAGVCVCVTKMIESHLSSTDWFLQTLDGLQPFSAASAHRRGGWGGGARRQTKEETEDSTAGPDQGEYPECPT